MSALNGFETSNIYTFLDANGSALSIMIMKRISSVAYFVATIDEDKNEEMTPFDSLIEALDAAAMLVYYDGLRLLRITEVPGNIGGVDHWRFV